MPSLTFHQDSYTISFDEDENKFESFHSYKPEMMGCLNTTLLTFKDGGLWKHTTSAVYCNFYGTQYPCFIQAVFAGDLTSKKTWLSVMQNGNTVWSCPEIYTQMESDATTRQESELLETDFVNLESEYHASFLRDINSIGGLIEGNQLKGVFVVIKFQKNNPSTFVYLNSATVKFINSPLNNR
jgi:hypothetical protein